MKLTYTFLIALLACATALGQSSELKLNLEKNKVYRLQANSEQTINQTINGNQQTVESKTSNTVSLKVVDATSAFLVAEVHFDTLSSKTNSMGITSNMSSALEGDMKSQKPADIMSTVMNRLSNSPVYAKIDFTGKVLEIINLKMIADMSLKDTAEMSLTGPAAATLKSQIVNMVNENSIITMIEMFTRYLPGKAVAPGDKWTTVDVMHSGGMSLQVSSSSQLEKVSGNVATVTAESEIKAAENAPPMEMGAAKITYDDINGSGKSNLTIDLQTGLVTESTAKSHIFGNLGVNVQGMSMQIPMDITSDSTIKRLQ